jgi:hypothetical protein
MNIKTIKFNYLRNEGHYEFLVVFLNLLNKFPGVLALVLMLVAEFERLLELEKKTC